MCQLPAGEREVVWRACASFCLPTEGELRGSVWEIVGFDGPEPQCLASRPDRNRPRLQAHTRQRRQRTMKPIAAPAIVTFLSFGFALLLAAGGIMGEPGACMRTCRDSAPSPGLRAL